MAFDVKGAISDGISPSEIADHLASTPGLVDFDVAAARKDGVPDAEIISHLADQQGGTAESLGTWAYKHAVPGSIQRGVAHAVDGAATTADVLGYSGTGKTLHNSVDQEQLNAPTSQNAITEDLKGGHYLHALTNVPGAIGEAIPQLAADVGLAGVGTAAGGAIGGPGGGAAGFLLGASGSALTNVVLSAGQIAQARAKADGRVDAQGNPQVNQDDINTAVGSSAVLGALNRLGLGEQAGAMVANGVSKLLGDGVKGTAGKLIGAAGVHAVADGAQALGQQAAETAGTQQGYTPDLAAAAGQAVTGAATRVGLGGVRRVVDQFDGTQTARVNDDLAQQYGSMSPDEQSQVQNLAAARKAVLDAQADKTQNPVTPSANQASRTLLNGVGGYADTAKTLISKWADPETGVLSKGEANDLTRLVSQAANSQRPVSTDTISDTIGKTNLPDQTKQLLTNVVTQMDMMSTAGINKRDTSLAGDLAELALGHIPIVGKLAGSLVGKFAINKVAQWTGTSDPTLIRQGKQAARMLDAAGVDIPNTREGMLDAINQTQNTMQAQAQALGLDPSKYGPTPAEKSAQVQAQVQALQQPSSDPTIAAAQAPATQQGVSSNLADIQARAAAQQEATRQATAQQAGQTMPNPTDQSVASNPAVQSAQARSILQSSRQPDQGFASLMGERLPDWQYGVANDVQQALNLSGTPKNINMAQETTQAVRKLMDQGVLDHEMGNAILAHKGRLVEGVYNLIRNEALLNHGIDRRTLAAQQQTAPSP